MAILAKKGFNLVLNLIKNMEEELKLMVEESQKTIVKTKEKVKTIAKITELIIGAIEKNNKLMVCGNGGSAAEAQHFAEELSGRYKRTRRGLPAISLTCDGAVLTCISNDYGFDKVFSRQVEALGNKEDILVLLSTSGNSTNLIEAIKTAKKIEVKTIGILGKGGGQAGQHCDISLIIESDSTERIQESHLLIIHMICEMIDKKFVK